MDEHELLIGFGSRYGLWPHSADPVLRARGGENTTFLVDGYIVRLSADSDAVAREVELLTALAAATRVPVPLPLAHETGIFAYRALPGEPLLTRKQRGIPGLVNGLVDVLSALREVAPACGLPVDDYPLETWHADAVAAFDEIRSHLPAHRVAVVERFLAEPLPPAWGRRVPQHNDLGAEHILVDADGRVSGILDWTDAALTDPARDLGMLHRDLGSKVALSVGRALDGPLSDGDGARIRFHARCKWIEDVRFALTEPSLRADYLANAIRTFDAAFEIWR